VKRPPNLSDLAVIVTPVPLGAAPKTRSRAAQAARVARLLSLRLARGRRPTGSEASA
jgi:hypothetical protein